MASETQCPDCGAWSGEWCDSDCKLCEAGECPLHKLLRQMMRNAEAGVEAIDWIVKHPKQTLDTLVKIGYLGHGFVYGTEDWWLCVPDSRGVISLDDDRTVYFVDDRE